MHYGLYAEWASPVSLGWSSRQQSLAPLIDLPSRRDVTILDYEAPVAEAG